MKPETKSKLEEACATVGAIAILLRTVAIADISAGEKIEGFAIDWLSERLDDARDEISDALDGDRRAAA